MAKSRRKIDSKKVEPEVIEYHEPVICERVKIQCDKCKIIYAVALSASYGFCSQCMGKSFTEIEGSRRVF